MRKQDQLVQLISTMSASEKRYFKLFCNIQSGEKKYLRLFHLLENATQYDTKWLCKEANLNPQQLTAEKHYLNQVLLKSLKSYADDFSETNSLYSQKEQARMLYMRRLYIPALDLTEKLIVKAMEIELHDSISELLAIKINCLASLSRYKEVEEVVLQHKKNAAILQEYVEIKALRTKAMAFEMERKINSLDSSFIKQPLLKDINKLQSLKAKLLWLDLHICYYNVTADSKKSLEVSLKQEALYKKYPQAKYVEPAMLLAHYSRLASIYENKGEDKKALAIVAQVEEAINDPNLQAGKERKIYFQHYIGILKARALQKMGRNNEALLQCETLYKLRQSKQPNDQFFIIFQYAVTLLHCGKPAEARDRINELLQLKTNARQDAIPFVRFMFIMAQLDLNSYATLPSQIRATKVWFERNRVVHEEIDLFLKHALAIAKTPLNRRAEWLKLQQLTNADVFKVCNQHLQFNRWVDQAMAKQKRV